MPSLEPNFNSNEYQLILSSSQDWVGQGNTAPTIIGDGNYIRMSIFNDNNKFEENSVKMIYSLPVNSFTLVSDNEKKIYLVKIVSSKKNNYSKKDDNYLTFVNNHNTNNRNSILQSYDQLLNNKYQVELNQKTIDRVKNYFK